MNDYEAMFVAGALTGIAISLLVVSGWRNLPLVVRDLWRHLRSRGRSIDSP